ncbi:AsmA family protein [Salinarimonas sp.]|uniref:AsmA family protein n=1 Tax=Salinarimonas sp. TaxID=2766526 RepID=UPI00391BACC6
MRRGVLRGTGLTLVALLAVGAALLLLPFFLPADAVRARIEAEIAQRTGFRVAFEGPVSLSVFPAIALAAERLRIEGPGDGADDFAADIEAVRFGLALAPLLSGEVRITEIALDRPVMRIVRGAATRAPADEAGESGLGRLAGVAIDRLAIARGLVVLRGEGGETRIEDLELALSMPDPGGPTRLSAAWRVGALPLAIDAQVESPLALVGGEAAALTARIEAPGLLAAPVSARASARLAPSLVALRDLALESGASRVRGEADVFVAGPLPALDARLAGDLLDLDALLVASQAAPQDDARPFGALTPLFGLLVGDLDLALARLVVDRREIAPLAARAALDEDTLEIAIAQAGLLGGSLAGDLRLGLDGSRARLDGSLRGHDLALGALAPSLPASGRIGADLRFAMAGETRAALVESLNAAGRVSWREGTLVGSGLAEAIGDPAADRLEAIALEIEIPDLVSAVSLSGTARWRGDPVSLAASVAARPILLGDSGRIDARLTAPRFALGLRGDVSAAGRMAGEVSLETESLRALLAWLGRPVAAPDGLGPFAFVGRVAASPGSLAFTDARLSLDGASAAGSGRLATGPRPRIEARLEADRLDVNPYLGLTPRGAATAQASGADGWSEAPIDLSALRAFDAELELALGSLVVRDIRTGPTRLSARLAAGRLDVDLHAMALYGGNGAGRIGLDAGAPSLAAALTIENVDARPFLSDAVDFRRIEGRGSLVLDVTAPLASEAALMRGLSGSARFSVRDGAIRGFDATQVAGLLATGIVDGWRLADGSATEFFAFETQFGIAGGAATTSDLRLVGPSIDTTGRGVIDIGARRLDLRVEPRVALERRRGDSVELVGFGAPILIAGPWDRPRIYPDVAGILQDPIGAYEQLRAAGRGLFGRDLPSAQPAIERAIGREAAQSIGDLLGVPLVAPPPVPESITEPASQPPVEGAPLDLAAPPPPPAPSPAAAPTGDPALDAARGLMELLLRNR